jgi:hypothetical protein
VRKRILDVLQAKGASALVSSAACGADLLALSAAGTLGLRRIVVLPFERAKFRETSVTDRPGDWASLYDTILDEVQKNGDLLVPNLKSDEEAYVETNHVIVDEAISLGHVLVLDLTSVFSRVRASRQFEERSQSTPHGTVCNTETIQKRTSSPRT